MFNTLNPEIGSQYWNHDLDYLHNRFSYAQEELAEIRWDWERLSSRYGVPPRTFEGDDIYVANMPEYRDIRVAPHRIFTKTHSDHNTIAGTVELADSAGVHATMSFTAYRKADPSQSSFSKRPVIFVSNGGPVSATTLWNALELTAPLGVIHWPDDEHTPQDRLTRRAITPLDYADVVHIDAVGAGWGRPQNEKSEDRFTGIEPDAQSYAAFMEWFLDSYSDGDAAIYQVMSSYGGTRGPRIANYLLEQNRNLGGIMLISPGYERYPTTPLEADPRTYISQLANFAATFQYHGYRRPPSPGYLRARYDDADYFAWTEYADFLLRERHTHAARQRLAKKMSDLIGIRASTIIEEDMKISTAKFSSTVLKLCDQQVSALDSRLAFPRQSVAKVDPAFDKWKPAYAALAVEHFRNHCGYVPETGHTYVGHKNLAPRWLEASRATLATGQAAVTSLLQQAPGLRIVETRGMFDLLKPDQAQLWDTLSPPEYADLPKQADVHYGDIRAPLVSKGVNIFVLPSGHQPGAEEYSRERSIAILRALVQAVN